LLPAQLSVSTHWLLTEGADAPCGEGRWRALRPTVLPRTGTAIRQQSKEHGNGIDLFPVWRADSFAPSLVHCDQGAHAGVWLLQQGIAGSPGWLSDSRRSSPPSILRDVFIELDASLGIAQQPCQCDLMIEESVIAQILAITLDKVAGVEDRGSSGLSTGQLLEP
jgi:hypothetical protein